MPTIAPMVTASASDSNTQHHTNLRYTANEASAHQQYSPLRLKWQAFCGLCRVNRDSDDRVFFVRPNENGREALLKVTNETSLQLFILMIFYNGNLAHKDNQRQQLGHGATA